MKRTAARLVAGLMIAGGALGVSAGSAMADDHDWNVAPQETDWQVAPQETDWQVAPLENDWNVVPLEHEWG